MNYMDEDKEVLMTTFLTGLIDFMVNLIGTHIPEYDFTAETYNQFSDSIVAVVNFLTDVNFIVPLGDIATIILLTVALKLFKFSLFVGNWLIRRVADFIP